MAALETHLQSPHLVTAHVTQCPGTTALAPGWRSCGKMAYLSVADAALRLRLSSPSNLSRRRLPRPRF